MYNDVIIPTWELALVMITCLFVGYYIGDFVNKWKKLK